MSHPVRINAIEYYQPVAKVPLHSTDDASRLTALLVSRIFPIFSLLAPCQPGASPVSVRRGTFATGCYGLKDGGEPATVTIDVDRGVD